MIASFRTISDLVGRGSVGVKREMSQSILHAFSVGLVS
jgi:hypothetical protein